MTLSGYLVGPGGSRAVCRYIEKKNRQFLLVEANSDRCKGLTDDPHFVDCMPEAIRQAIVLLKFAKYVYAPRLTSHLTIASQASGSPLLPL
jgi:hypothetical protein